MSTPANPQHLLRRPKKPQPKSVDGRVILGGIAAIVVGGAIAGFVVFGHGKSAANPPAPAATVQLAQVATFTGAQTDVPPISATTSKHAAHKHAPPSSATPAPGATQTPTPSPTTAPTPAAPSDASSAAAAAKARHLAALRLAALRHAASVIANDSNASLLTPTSVDAPPATTPASVPTPAATAPPTQAPTAVPDVEPTPIYAPTIVVDARFVDRVTPVYPDVAREQGAQGTAVVLATIGPDGRVESVSVDQSTGNKLLDGAALSAARSSRFEPPAIDGKPATETYRIVYTFDPNG